MQFLKNLPIGYTAHLKDIRLINFTVNAKELALYLPKLPLVEIEGEPVVSVLDVQLGRLRPSFLLKTFHFAYRHIAFRVLVRDDQLNDDKINRGIFYLSSFTNSQFIAKCGKLFTNFNFRYAQLNDDGNKFCLNYKQKYLNYTLDFESPVKDEIDLKESLMQIDRTYSLNSDRLNIIRIKRNDLPLQPVLCRNFETNFFEIKKFLGAYFVKEELEYEWLPPQNGLPVNFSASR